MTWLFEQETVTRFRENRLKKEAFAEGEARGRAEGEAKGRAEGEARGRTEGEATGNLRGFVTACCEFGSSPDEAAARLAKKFHLPAAAARAEVDRYWGAI